MRKLFDSRFSYKHCNFSYVWLLLKIACIENRDKVYFTPHCVHNVLMFFCWMLYNKKPTLALSRVAMCSWMLRLPRNAQGSKAISQFLDGCAPTPPPPSLPRLPRTTWLYTVNSQQFIFSKFYLAYRKILQLSSQSRVELLISTICEVSSWLHAGHIRFRLIES